MTLLDWPGLMRAGMKGLGLTPEEFWNLTPIELKIMLGSDGPSPAISRARFDELAAAYPDTGKAGIGDGHR
jgi:uncharacterized phage protein (TIGR02216 family)